MSTQKPDPLAKVMTSHDRRPDLNRKVIVTRKYMDKMDRALNQNILDNVRPFWRNHSSTKGK